MKGTKKNIFESAIKTISKNGYNGATMDVIALNAGVAKGTLYYYFKSKEEIFNYIVNEGIKELQQTVKEELDKTSINIDKIKTLCYIHFKFINDNKDLFKIILSQFWGQEIRHLNLQGLISNYIKFIESYVKDAMDKNIIKRGDTCFIASTFLGMVLSASLYELSTKDSMDEEELSKNLINYLINGINL